MLNGKFIISVFLLLTYFIGWTHELVPHFHHAHTENHAHGEIKNSQDNHHHHNHNMEGNTEHVDHVDESILDVFLCLISGMEHSTNDCAIHNYFPSSIKRVGKKQMETASVICVFQGFYTLPILENAQIAVPINIPIYKHFYLSSLKLRGPPQA